jgi:hypothetical protein
MTFMKHSGPMPLVTATGVDARTATVSVGQGSVQHLAYRHDAAVGPVVLDLEQGSDEGHGTITNHGDTTLCGAVLYYADRSSVEVGDLAPGASRSVQWRNQLEMSAGPPKAATQRFARMMGVHPPDPLPWLLKSMGMNNDQWAQYWQDLCTYPAAFVRPMGHNAELVAWTTAPSDAPAASPAVADVGVVRIVRVHGDLRLAPGRVTLHYNPVKWQQSGDKRGAILPGVVDGARCVSLEISAAIPVWDAAHKVWVTYEPGRADANSARFVDSVGRVWLCPGSGPVTVTATLEH